MYKSKKEVHKEIRSWFSCVNMTQEEVANSLKIKQGQLSKILNGEFVRVNSETIKKVCKYANIDLISNKEVEPEKSEILIRALKEVWDGRRKSEKKLASIIMNFKGLI